MPSDKQNVVAHAVRSKSNKKRFPSLLSKVKGSGSGAARLIPFHKRTNAKKPEMPPPVSSVTADQRQDKISDLTTHEERRTAAPPVRQIDSNQQQSAASSLTLSAALNRSQSSTIHTEATENITQNQLLQPLGARILPKTPKTSNEKKHLELNSGIRLNAPSPVTLDKYEVQASVLESEEPHLSQSPMSEGSSSQPDPSQKVLYSDDYVLDKILKDPAIDEASIGSDVKPKTKKIAFAKVKALLRQVQQKQSAEDPEPDTKLVDGIPVVSASGSLTGPPVIEAAYSFREYSITKASGGRPASPEPSKRSRHPEVLSTSSQSILSSTRRKSVDPNNEKLAAPSPVAKHARRSLSPELSVGFGNTGSQKIQRGIDPGTSPVNGRIPVDAPEEEDDVFMQWSPATTRDEHDVNRIPTRVVGIPVEVNAYDVGTEAKRHGGPFKFNPFDSEAGPEEEKLQENRGSLAFKTVRNGKSYNPFDSSASEASVPKKADRNPFDSSDDDDDDVFATIVSSARKEAKCGDFDKSEGEGIPAPNYKLIPSPTEARKKSRRIASPVALADRTKPNNKNSYGQPDKDGFKTKTKKKPGRVKVLVDRFSGQQVNLPGIVDTTGTTQISDLDQSLRHFPVKLVEEKKGVADISHLDETAGQTTHAARNSANEEKESAHSRPVTPGPIMDKSTALADSSTDESSKRSKGDLFASDSPLTKMLVGRLVSNRRGDGVDSAYRKQRLTGKARESGTSASDEYNSDPAVLDHASSEIYRMTMKTPRISNGWNNASDASGLKLGGESITAANADQYSNDISALNQQSNVNLSSEGSVKSGGEDDAARVYLDKLQKFGHATMRISPSSNAIAEDLTQVNSKKEESDTVDQASPGAKPEEKLNHVFKKLRDSRASSKSSSSSSAESDTSILLSQLEDFGANVKRAAKNSLLKAEKEGSNVPPWTQELVDLTGIKSFDDLEDEEAVWLFEMGSNEQKDRIDPTPKSDLESVMQFAAKRLGLSVGDTGPKSVLSNEEALSAVVQGLLPCKGSGLPEAPKIEPTTSAASDIKLALSPTQSPENEYVIKRSIESNRRGEKIDQDQFYQELTASKSSFDDKSEDKYLVSESEENNYADGEYESKYETSSKLILHGQPLDDSDVSSTDNLSLIMSKLQRDCNQLERRRAQLKIETESRTEHWAEETESQQGGNSTRRDFLELLLETTGVFFCGKGAEPYEDDYSKDNNKKGKNKSRLGTLQKQRKSRSDKATSPDLRKEAKKPSSPGIRTVFKEQESDGSVESVHETVEIIASEKFMSGITNAHNPDDRFLEMEPSPIATRDSDSLRHLRKVRVPLDPEANAFYPAGSPAEENSDVPESTTASDDKSLDSRVTEKDVNDQSDGSDKNDDKKADSVPHSPQEGALHGGPKPEDFIRQRTTDALSPDPSTTSTDRGDVPVLVRPVAHYPSQQKSQDTLDMVFESAASRDTSGIMNHPILSNETDIPQSENSGESDFFPDQGMDATSFEGPLSENELKRRSILLQPLGFFVPESRVTTEDDTSPPCSSDNANTAEEDPTTSNSNTDLIDPRDVQLEHPCAENLETPTSAMKTVNSCEETTIQLLAGSASTGMDLAQKQASYHGDGSKPETAIVIEEDNENQFYELVPSFAVQESLNLMSIRLAISQPHSNADIFDGERADDDVNFAISPSTTSSPRKKPFFEEPDMGSNGSVNASTVPVEAVPGEISVQKRKEKSTVASATDNQEDKDGRDDSSSSIDLIPKSFLVALGLGGGSSWGKSSNGNEIVLSKDALAALGDDERSSGGESASLLLALTRSETETNVSGSPANQSRHKLDDDIAGENKDSTMSPSFSGRKSRRSRLERAKLVAKKARTPSHDQGSKKFFEFDRTLDSIARTDSKQRSTQSQLNSVLGRLEIDNDSDEGWTQPPEMTMTRSLSHGSSTDTGEFPESPRHSSRLSSSDRREWDDQSFGSTAVDPIDAEAFYANYSTADAETDDIIIDVTDLTEEADVIKVTENNAQGLEKLDEEKKLVSQAKKKKSPGTSEVQAISSGDSSHTPLLKKVVDRMRRAPKQSEEKEITTNSSSESSEMDELFRRYNSIVKDMVVFDEERLAKLQIAKIVGAADSVVRTEQAKLENGNLSLRNRRKSTGGLILISSQKESFKNRTDKALNLRVQPAIRRVLSSGSLVPRHSDSNGSDDASHPSQKARELREQIEEALQTSAAIRASQKELTVELTSFQSRIQERRAKSPDCSPISRSAPNSPFWHRQSYYHRNCASHGSGDSDDATPVSQVHEAYRLCGFSISPSKTTSKIDKISKLTTGVPMAVVAGDRTFSRDVSSMKSYDSSDNALQYSDDEEAEEIQSQRVESILSGLRMADSAASDRSQAFRKKIVGPGNRQRNSNAF